MLLVESLCLIQLQFVLGNPLIQILSQVVFLTLARRYFNVAFIFFDSNVLLKLLDLLLILFDDFLAEMTPSRKLILNLSMVDYILLQLFYYLLHLLLFVHLVLRLLGLVLKFTGDGCILNNGQLCSANKLVLIHIQHFDFHSTDFK